MGTRMPGVAPGLCCSRQMCVCKGALLVRRRQKCHHRMQQARTCEGSEKRSGARECQAQEQHTCSSSGSEKDPTFRTTAAEHMGSYSSSSGALVIPCGSHSLRCFWLCACMCDASPVCLCGACWCLNSPRFRGSSMSNTSTPFSSYIPQRVSKEVRGVLEEATAQCLALGGLRKPLPVPIMQAPAHQGCAA